jgi:hypothetical protein
MSPYWKIGVLLSALTVVGTTTHFADSLYYGKKLALEKEARASDIARINAVSAETLREAQKNQQRAESKISELDNLYIQAISNHAKDSMDYRAKLASGAERVRVKVADCRIDNASVESSSASGKPDAGTAYGFLPPASAERLIAVADLADAEREKLKYLQDYVISLQDQGYIGK